VSVVTKSVVVAAWGITIGLALVVGARLIAFDDGRVFVLANALTYWAFLPIYVVLAMAIAMGRRGLAAFAAVVVLAHVVLVWPSLGDAAAIPRDARTAPRVRVVSANLLFDNAESDALLRELAATNADVLALQELSHAWLDELRGSALWDRYPYRLVEIPRDVTGSAIFSKLPLRDTAVQVARHSPLLSATVDVGGRAVRIANIHPNAPAFHYPAWARYTERVDELVRDATGRLVVVGDYNATQFNRWLGDLADLGLRSVHEDLGRGTATTWPNGQLTALPIRLDHVMVSAGVVGLTIREGDGPGSDHRPVITDLALTKVER
jgi:endonuclease/exonuclease/phosphatase (EEP) superfamily protein YafD